MKKRYIDAELIRKLKIACIAKYPYSYIDGIFALAREIEDIPTADVVEVVRCRNCKHRRETMHRSYCLPAFGLKQITDLNGFCSYGERKDAE